MTSASVNLQRPRIWTSNLDWIAGLAPAAAARVLAHSYLAVIPIAPLPYPPLPLSPLRPGEPRAGEDSIHDKTLDVQDSTFRQPQQAAIENSMLKVELRTFYVSLSAAQCRPHQLWRDCGGGDAVAAAGAVCGAAAGAAGLRAARRPAAVASASRPGRCNC